VRGNGFKVTSAETGPAPSPSGTRSSPASPSPRIRYPPRPTRRMVSFCQPAAPSSSKFGFEWTGGLYLAARGSAPVTINNNEFARACILRTCQAIPAAPLSRTSRKFHGRKLSRAIVSAPVPVHRRHARLAHRGNGDAETTYSSGRARHEHRKRKRRYHPRQLPAHDYSGGWSQGIAASSSTCRTCSWSTRLSATVPGRSSRWAENSDTISLRGAATNGCARCTATRSFITISCTNRGGGDPAAGIWIYGNQTDISLYNNTLDGSIDYPRFRYRKGRQWRACATTSSATSALPRAGR